MIIDQHIVCQTSLVSKILLNDVAGTPLVVFKTRQIPTNSWQILTVPDKSRQQYQDTKCLHEDALPGTAVAGLLVSRAIATIATRRVQTEPPTKLGHGPPPNVAREINIGLNLPGSIVARQGFFWWRVAPTCGEFINILIHKYALKNSQMFLWKNGWENAKCNLCMWMHVHTCILIDWWNTMQCYTHNVTKDVFLFFPNPLFAQNITHLLFWFDPPSLGPCQVTVSKLGGGRYQIF